MSIESDELHTEGNEPSFNAPYSIWGSCLSKIIGNICMLEREEGAAGGIKLFTEDFFRSLFELLVLGEVLMESPSLVTWICTGSSGILITVETKWGKANRDIVEIE